MSNTSFPKLVITSVDYRAFGESRSFIVPNRIYGYGDERVETVEEALEVVFRQLNAVDGNELISEPEFRAKNPRLRSMSVGDLVTFRGPGVSGGWRKQFICEGLGWSEVID